MKTVSFYSEDQDFITYVTTCGLFIQRAEEVNNYQQNCCWLTYDNKSGKVIVETGCVNEYGSRYTNKDKWECHICNLPLVVRQFILS